MKKIFLTFLLTILSFVLTYGQTNKVVPSGSGTELDPYLIASLGNLSWLTQNSGEWDKFYKQTVTIDASETANWDDVDDNGDGDLFNDANDITATGNNEGWLPIGTLSGVYDGNGNTISNLTITANRKTSGNAFLDALTGNVETLGLTSIDFSGHTYVAGLVGRCRGNITNCYTTGIITCVDSLVNKVRFGGLIAEALSSSEISNSYSEVNITGTSTGHSGYMGGFIGDINSALVVVTDCHATGNITDGGTSAGGFVGYLHKVSVLSNCYSTGNVDGLAQSVGGFIGKNRASATVSRCYSTGNVTGAADNVGGFVGMHDGQDGSCEISECYSTGDVTADQEVGGFVGYIEDVAIIINSYSLGSVTCSGGNDSGGFCGELDDASTKIEKCYSIGELIATGKTNQGFIGDFNSSGTDVDNYYDATTSKQTSTKGNADSKTTAEMQAQATFVNWDFASIWEIVGTNYPRLQNIPDTSLPVELTSFDAVVVDETVLLTWATATEVNNYGFQVEKMDAGIDEWVNVAFVDGAGNSNSPKQYSYVDTSTPLSASVSYRLKQIDTDGAFEYSNVVAVNLNNLAKTKLFQNHPNPFNPTTKISFSLSALSNVKISVYNILGEKVAELINNKMEAGNHSVNYNASELTSGVYIYRIDTPNYTKSMKMILMK